MQTVHSRRGTRTVQSRQNSRVKELRSALGRGGRSPEGRIAIEGLHLTEEAQRSGLVMETIFVREGDESLLDTLTLSDECEVLILPADVFASAVSTESPQGIAALVRPPVFAENDAFLGIPLVIVAAGLQDPGNLGTLIRSSEAFGATGIVTLPGTVSQWNPKALRASSGSAFRLPLVSTSQEELLTMLRQRCIRLLATTVKGGVALGRNGPGAANGTAHRKRRQRIAGIAHRGRRCAGDHSLSRPGRIPERSGRWKRAAL